MPCRLVQFIILLASVVPVAQSDDLATCRWMMENWPLGITQSGSSVSVVDMVDFINGTGPCPAFELSIQRSFSFPSQVLGVAYSPDETALAAVDLEGHIKVWNPSNWALRWSGTTSKDRASQVSFSPDGSRLLVTHDDGVDIFAVSDGSLVCPVENPDSKGINGAFASADTYFSTSFFQLFLHSNLCHEGTLVFTSSEGDFQREACMAFDSSLNAVSATTSHGALFVWDALTGSLLTQQWVIEDANAFDMCFNETGSRLLVVGYDTVKIFHTDDWTSESFSTSILTFPQRYSACLMDHDSSMAIGGYHAMAVIDIKTGFTRGFHHATGRFTAMSWSETHWQVAMGLDTIPGALLIAEPF